jgi:hypothetical protein
VTVIDNIGNYKKLTGFIEKVGNSAKIVCFSLNIPGEFGIITNSHSNGSLAENRTSAQKGTKRLAGQVKKSIILHHKCQSIKHFGVSMTNKHLFSRLLKKAILMALWAKASLCGKSSLLEQSLPRTPSRLQIKVRPKGLHSFAFFFQSLIPRPQSLTPNPQSLIPNPSPLPPDPWPRTPNVIVYKYLRAEKLLYICRELSTSVESSLQINLFMQNKANFRKVKLNVNKVLTRDYDIMDTWSIRKTKPIQSQLKPIQSQLKPIKCQNKANSNPNKANSCPPLVWRIRAKKCCV